MRFGAGAKLHGGLKFIIHRSASRLALLVVNIKADGEIVMSAKTVTYEDFQTRMQDAARSNPDYSIIIRGDKATPYEFIAKVLDICNGAGIWNIALPVSKAE